MTNGRHKDADARQRARGRARAMRRQSTEAYQRLWWHLRRRIPLQGTYFRRQVRLGRYFVDFSCLKARLLVEVEGGQQMQDSVARHDGIRTRALEAQGFMVIRFSNTEVLQQTDAVVETIYAHLAASCPQALRA